MSTIYKKLSYDNNPTMCDVAEKDSAGYVIKDHYVSNTKFEVYIKSTSQAVSVGNSALPLELVGSDERVTYKSKGAGKIYTLSTTDDYETLKKVVDTKQDELTAGDNITITGNVISATGGTIADGSVTTAKLADGAVTLDKIASDLNEQLNRITATDVTI